MANTSKLCSIEGCGRKRFARNWCQRHYQRWYKYGDPTFSPRPGWAAEDDAFLLANPSMTHANTAAALGRTVEAVKQRRYQLRKSGSSVGQFRAQDAMPLIGGRPLLAKTCIYCGLLLDAHWFHARPGGPAHSKSECRKCAGEEGRRGERKPVLDVAGWETPRAGYDWTDREIEVLARDDLSLVEMAQELGRTRSAVATARKVFGLPPRWTPLDEPVPTWVIRPGDPPPL